MKVNYISYPCAFTDTGARVDIKNIVDAIRVGVMLKQNEDKYEVVAASTGEVDCHGGVCPIK